MVLPFVRGKMGQEAHAKSFTVAKATRLDVLQEIRGEVQRALDKGITEHEFIKTLEPRLKKLGWWGKQVIVDSAGNAQVVQLGSPWRLRTIYRTNLQTAYMAGRYKQQIRGVRRRPWWQYVAVLDARLRPGHRALHGRVLRHDDAFWDSFYPPNGWNCRCRVRTLTDRQIATRKLTPESSAGRLQDFEVEAGVDKRTGEVRMATVKGFRYTDAKGEEQWFRPDAGWSYNPGKAAFDIDPSKYDPDLLAKALAEKTPPLPAAAPTPPAPRPQTLGEYIDAGKTLADEIAREADASGLLFQQVMQQKLRAERSFGQVPAKVTKFVKPRKPKPGETPKPEETKRKAPAEDEGRGASLVREASAYYPDDWNRAANEFGPLHVKYSSRGRGWSHTDRLPAVVTIHKPTEMPLPLFGTVPRVDKAGYIATHDTRIQGRLVTSVHEYAHRLQNVMPELDALFQQLHRRRTAAEDLVRLKDIDPGRGYKPHEHARPDKYFDPYQGKEYGARAALEMMTMAFEAVLGYDDAWFQRFRAHDPEMLHLALGVLRHYKP